MYIRECLFFALLALTCLIVTAQVVGGNEITEEIPVPTCDTRNEAGLKEWSQVRKKKAKCKFGEYPTCTKCEMNKNKKRAGWQKNCADCPLNYGTLTEGSVKCKKYCKVGFYYDTTEESCTKCPLDTYMDVSCLNTSCTPCPEGKKTAKIGSTSEDMCLLECEAGKQASADQSTCEPCPMGTYHDTKDTEQCKECPNNKTTIEAGTKTKNDCVKVCEPGKELNVTTGLCQACEKHFYKDSASSLLKCQPCPVNTVTSSKGQAQCEAECWAGYESDSAGGCHICPWGTYKVKSGNIDQCLSCTVEGGPVKVTDRQGALKKGECVKRDECVAPALERLTDYYQRVAEWPFRSNENIISFWKQTCFAEISVLITQIIADFKTCEDLLQNVKLPDVKIGGRTYKGIDQLTLFAEAASYSDSYCEYLRHTDDHIEEIAKCKTVMEDDPGQPLNICSEQWRVGAKCIKLNAQNSGALKFHPSLTEEIKYPNLPSPMDIYTTQDIDQFCSLI